MHRISYVILIYLVSKFSKRALSGLLTKTHYHNLMLELCAQRFHYIDNELKHLELKSADQAAWNEFYLALYLQKAMQYEVSLIDASTAELIGYLQQEMQKGQGQHRKKMRTATGELLQENCYYSTYFFFLYCLCLRINGNMLKQYPNKFQSFYNIFIKKREDLMHSKILNQINRLKLSGSNQNVMILVGQYHFDSLHSLLLDNLTNSNSVYK